MKKLFLLLLLGVCLAAVFNGCGNNSLSTQSSSGSAPAIISVTENITGSIGGSLTLEVTASGDDLTYQWMKDETDMGSETESVLYIHNFQIDDVGAYKVRVSNSSGSVTSRKIYVNDQGAPTITSLSENVSASTGDDFELYVTATGDNLQYRWEKDGVALEAQNESRLYVGNFVADKAGSYRVVVSNASGSVTSSRIVVNDISSDNRPVITSVTEDQDVLLGTDVVFSVTASGDDLNYQWYKNTSIMTGETDSSLSIRDVADSDEGYYRVIVTNTNGSVTSQRIYLDIEGEDSSSRYAPTITSFSSDMTVDEDASPVLRVVATSTATPSYAWYHNGTKITDETTSTLRIFEFSEADEGTYWVAVSNAYGSVTSDKILVQLKTTYKTMTLGENSCNGYQCWRDDTTAKKVCEMNGYTDVYATTASPTKHSKKYCKWISTGWSCDSDCNSCQASQAIASITCKKN